MRLQRVRTSSVGQSREPVEPEAKVLQIRDPYITLAQALKMAGLISTGGEARYYLAGAELRVNGEHEQRPGRKLRPGDVVTSTGEAPLRIEAGTAEGIEVESAPADTQDD